MFNQRLVTVDKYVFKSHHSIEKSNEGVIFTIRTISEPGNLLTKLLGPFFTLPIRDIVLVKHWQMLKIK
jgi:hypothetical protein